jgi:DNA-binding NarL/FixJ family response regulator
MSKLRVFIADAPAFVLEGLKAKVNAQPDMDVIGEATDGRTAIQRVQKLLPDVVGMSPCQYSTAQRPHRRSNASAHRCASSR